MLVPPAVPMVVGENAAVTPVGNPVTVNATLEANPFEGVAVTAN